MKINIEHPFSLKRLVLISLLLLHLGCAPAVNTRPPSQGPSLEGAVEAPDWPSRSVGGRASPSSTVPGQGPGGAGPAGEKDLASLGRERAPSRPFKMTNQALLDSALEYCQASNDFWDRGDLNSALEALDKAYSLILKVEHDENPEVLQQKEDLRFTISKRIIEVYSSRFTVANGYHKAVPLTSNKHVERALALFKGKERKFFLNAYRRAGKYREPIVKALQEAGLPEELSWLPLIESGFKVRALGLWQFIASTGYKFGLKRDRWIDERMDPEKSTRAAIAYLKELHQIFGDWTTVLAAYNCGEGAVLNRIKRQRINYLDNFWDLYEQLPNETAFYVPKFLAVLHILHDPAAHGFELPAFEQPIATETASMNKQVHLKTMARQMGVDYNLLKDLNPELRRHMTPCRPYELTVPLGKGAVLLAKLGDMPVYDPPASAGYASGHSTGHGIHKVRRGESLSVIAERYRTSVRAIQSYNNLRSTRLQIGQVLKIPGRGAPASSVQRQQSRVVAPAGTPAVYEVRKGDNLWSIANRYHTTTKAIQSFNNLRSTRLQIGQVLKIPVADISYQPFGLEKYQVRKGDNPYLIARRHRMDLVDFLKLNRLTPRSTIFPGQVVVVRAQ